MGEPKALVTVAGVPMARRVADALSAAGAEPVVLQGGPRSTGDVLGLPVVADEWPGEGPLAALATATAWAADLGAVLVVVAACDQPSLTASSIRSLVDAATGPGARSGTPVAGTVAVTPDGRRHPFPSVWATSAAPALRGLVAQGARRADAAWGLGVAEVAVEPGLVVDIDTPGELRAHRADRAGRGGTSDPRAASTTGEDHPFP